MDLFKIAKKIVEKTNGSVHTSVIRKTPGKEEWCVYSEKNPNWSGGCYKRKEKAEERLREIEFFKRKK